MMQTSLFDAPAQPAWHGASNWALQLLTGSVAVSLCILAVALLGFLLLKGQLPIRRGGQIIAGCFLLLGSMSLAFGLLDLGKSAGSQPARTDILSSQQSAAEVPPPANFDPYAGASLRRRGAQ